MNEAQGRPPPPPLTGYYWCTDKHRLHPTCNQQPARLCDTSTICTLSRCCVQCVRRGNGHMCYMWGDQRAMVYWRDCGARSHQTLPPCMSGCVDAARACVQTNLHTRAWAHASAAPGRATQSQIFLMDPRETLTCLLLAAFLSSLFYVYAFSPANPRSLCYSLPFFCKSTLQKSHTGVFDAGRPRRRQTLRHHSPDTYCRHVFYEPFFCLFSCS